MLAKRTSDAGRSARSNDRNATRDREAGRLDQTEKGNAYYCCDEKEQGNEASGRQTGCRWDHRSQQHGYETNKNDESAHEQHGHNLLHNTSFCFDLTRTKVA